MNAQQPQNEGSNANPKQGGLSWSAPQPRQSAPKAPAQPTPAPAAPKVQAAPSSPSQMQSAKLAGWVAVGIVAGVVIAWGGTALVKKGTVSSAGDASSIQAGTEASSTAAAPGQGSDSSLTVMTPQKAGMSVAIAKAVVSEPTWIVVYENRGGQPGNVLGAALFFPDHESGTVDLLRGTVAGQTYFVTKQADDGDHKFSLKGDPLVMENGQAIWASFTTN